MRVGLTGGIASGKSTVAQFLVDLGAVLIDGDALAREVVARGTPGLAQVVEEFGEELLTAEGDLDRAALGRIVFSDESARRRLAAITHPLIFERYAELEAAAPARCWPSRVGRTPSTRSSWSTCPPSCRSSG